MFYLDKNMTRSMEDNILFIYNHSNVFISDNHLTAFWGWLK